MNLFLRLAAFFIILATIQPLPAMHPAWEFKKDDVCRVLCGEKKGRTVTILGTCLTLWNVTSVKDAAKNKPLIFQRDEVRAYCKALGVEFSGTESEEEIKKKVLKSKSPHLNMAFYVAVTDSSRIDGHEDRICLDANWIAKK